MSSTRMNVEHDVEPQHLFHPFYPNEGRQPCYRPEHANMLHKWKRLAICKEHDGRFQLCVASSGRSPRRPTYRIPTSRNRTSGMSRNPIRSKLAVFRVGIINDSRRGNWGTSRGNWLSFQLHATKVRTCEGLFDMRNSPLNRWEVSPSMRV